MNSINHQAGFIPSATAQNDRLFRLKARRQRWLAVHLWLGLTLGLLLSIYGITGSILVFHAEIARVGWGETTNPNIFGL
jgi:hypothetical protein